MVIRTKRKRSTIEETLRLLGEGKSIDLSPEEAVDFGYTLRPDQKLSVTTDANKQPIFLFKDIYGRVSTAPKPSQPLVPLVDIEEIIARKRREGVTSWGVQPPKVSIVPPSGNGDLPDVLKRIYPSMFEVGHSYGIKEEEMPLSVAETIRQWYSADPEGFLTDLQTKGRNSDTETLLRILGAEDKDIETLLPVTKPSKVTRPPKPSPTAFWDEQTQNWVEEETKVTFFENPKLWWQQQMAKSHQQVLSDVGVTARSRERFAQMSGIAGWANRPTVLANLTPTDIVGLGLMAYGGYQAATTGWNMFIRASAVKMVRTEAIKRFGEALPEETENNVVNTAINKLPKKYLTVEGIKNLFKRTPQGYQALPETVSQANAEILSLVRGEVSVIPKGTQTGAMAFGGKAVPPEIPPKVPVVKPIVPAVEPTAKVTPAPEVTKEGGLVAKFAETKMSPETGLDTLYTTEYRMVGAPDNAGAEWMGSPYGIVRVYSKGGVEISRDLIEVGQSEEKIIEAMPFETSYKKAEKFGYAKTVYDNYEKKLAKEEQTKVAKEEAEKLGYEKYREAVTTLGSIKGVKRVSITYPSPAEGITKTGEGFDVGNGVGVVIHKIGNLNEYAVTHLNTGLAMGRNWKNRAEAIALAKSAAKITDWSKFNNEKEIPKEIMDEAAKLVRGFTNKNLEVKPTITATKQPEAIPKAKPRIGVIPTSIEEAPAKPVEEIAPPPPPDRSVPPADTLPPAPTPPPIKPTRSGENVIGLRTIQPGLVRSETIGNLFKRTISKLGVQVVEAEPMANAAMNERARVAISIESNAAILGTKAVALLEKVFTFDKQGRIPSLAGIDITIVGAPTIQDVAARLPTYSPSLSDAQLNALREIKEMVESYRQLLEEVGVEVSARQDVVEGGFYLPRGRAALEGTDEPVKIGAGRRGMRKGFERPALFDSQAEGINKGFEYSPIGETLAAYAFDAGTRATDAHIVNYFKALTDDTGQLLGETVKMRMLKQNPEIAKIVEEIKGNLDKLKRNIGALTERQLAVIDLWQNDPEFSDIDTLLDGLETMRGGIPAQTLPELKALFEQNKEALKALRPAYKKALRRAQATPREQGIISLPALQGRTFPNEIANAANIVLQKEGKTIGALSPVINVVNAYNNLYRGLRATLDNSALGIQGLLGLYGDPQSYKEALKVNIKAWGVGGDKILGKFLVDFDAQATQNGRLTSSDWSRDGLHLGGAVSEFQLGAGTAISKLPIVRQANRAFGYFGDALRLEWAESELQIQMSKRSLDQIRESGDLERIADAANNMTGWDTKKAFGSLGDLVLFAPRFLQSRLATVVKAGMSARLNATLDQRMARMALLKLIGFGTILTILGNMLAGEDDTDFRPIVDGKRNGKFMRIKYQGHYYSVFGTWDSLLGMFINIGTGRPLQAIRSMGSGLTTAAFDIISGKDYNYKAVRDTPLHFIQWLGNSIVPFSVGQLPQGIKQFAGGIVDGEVNEAVGGGVNIISQVLGVKSYPEEDWKTNRLKLGLPMLDEPALYSTENPLYTFDKYASDAIAKLGTYNPKEIIGDKDYPADVQAIAQSREYRKELSSYPNRKLTSVNADSTKGDTYVEYYKQWQERQKLTDPDELKAFDTKYPKAEQGNMSQRQYVLLTQYNQITDKKRRAEFLIANPELSANPYQDWLKSHPKENALLSLTSSPTAGIKILTKEAYNYFKTMIKELDIPDSALPDLSMPPEGSVDNYFKYQDMENKASWETQLMLAKDTKLRDFLGIKPSDTPIASLELKVKNRANFDKLDGFSDKNSPDYIADEKKRAEAVKKFKTDNPTFVDDMRRIDAIEKGTTNIPTPGSTIKSYVDYMKLQDKEGVGSSSAEVMLARVDNPELEKWLTDSNIQGKGVLKPVDQSKIPIWRIDAKYAKQDTEYDALSSTGTTRMDYLVANSAYRMDRRRRDAYQKGLGDQVENYVSYYELPVKGYRQERFLLNNPAFTNALKLKMPDRVPSEEYDNLMEKTDRTPEDDLRMGAYKLYVPDNQIENYVAYKAVEGTAGYEDDWWMMEHPDYYQEVYLNKDIYPDHQRKDYREVPTREVYAKYLEFQKLGSTYSEDNYRWNNRDLDAWLVLTGKRKDPITEKKRQESMTPQDKLNEEVSKRLQGITELARR